MQANGDSSILEAAVFICNGIILIFKGVHAE